jgi:mannan endo-1,4-beta-mannosidase
MSDGGSGYSGSQGPSSSYDGSNSSEGYQESLAPSDGYSLSTSDGGGYSAYSQPKSAQNTSSRLGGRLFGNGVNFQPSYQQNGDVDLGWTLLKTIGAVQTVRLEIEVTAVTAAVRWISEATSQGYTVIATFHSFEALDDKRPASDDPKWMQRAVQFWSSNYKKLSAAGPFMINIMNEWGHKSIDPKTYADQYNSAIRTIRGFYPGPLIIDLPGYGQLAKVAADAVTGAGGITPIQDRNIILSMHVYPQTYNGKAGLTTADLDHLVETGRPCMIGEFGEDNKNPNTDWQAIVTYAKSLNWPVLAWAWDGDGEIMNIIYPEFQPFVAGKTFPYSINGQYANVVLPFLS